MSDDLKRVLEAALALDEKERAELTNRILMTIENQEEDVESGLSQAWREEIDRRFEAYKRGEEKAVELSELRRILKPDVTES